MWIRRQWQWLGVLVLIGLLVAAFAPPVVDQMEQIRSEAAIESAEQLRVAFQIFHQVEQSPLPPGGQLTFTRDEMDELLEVRGPDDGRALSDFLNRSPLRVVRSLRWHRPGTAPAYVIDVEFYESLGRYRRARITPDGLEWVGRG